MSPSLRIQTLRDECRLKKEAKTVLCTKSLKSIALIGAFALCLLLWPQRSWAVDKYYPYTSLYGDINLEFRSQGTGGGEQSSRMDHSLIHYYNLGLRSYIWDPRFIQYNLLGNFYQELRFGDVGSQDNYRFGGTASVTLFPRNSLRATLIYGRGMAFNPDITTTTYGIDALLFRGKWPVIGLNLSRYSVVSQDKEFPQDVDYTHAQLNLHHRIYFKPPRISENDNSNGNGNGNGGNETRKNVTDVKTPVSPNLLLINGFYDYYSVDDKLTNLSTQQHRAQLRLDYYFNNNRSYINNTYDFSRSNVSNNFQVSLNYYNRLPTQLSYSLGGSLSLSTGDNTTFGGGLSAGLSKVFSPQWTASAGVAGQFKTGGRTSFGISGFGNVFSRIFKDFDWGAGMSAGINTGEGDTNSNYALSLNAVYRLAPNKLLHGDYTLSLASGDNQALDSRLRLTFEGNWAPRFTLRSVAEFRLQNLSGSLTGGSGNNMAVSLDNYGIYRISSSTTLSAGVNFAHISTGADTENDQRFRIYATLTSSPMLNLSYNVTTELNYSVKDALWNVSINPQVYYVWRKLYFSLTGALSYFNDENRNGRWNYSLTFKVTRPFGLRF